MYRYADARFGAEERFGGIAASAFAPTGDLPPFLMAQLLFPYVAGEQFVARLLEVGGGEWTVVDTAFRFRPPASTEQILHPQAYLEVEQPDRVSVRGPAAALGKGWRELHGGTLGEWLTQRMLARAGGTGAPTPRRAGAATATRCSATASGARSSPAGAGTRRPTPGVRGGAARLGRGGAGRLAAHGAGRLAHPRRRGRGGAARRRPHARPGAVGGARAPRRAGRTSLAAARAGSSAVRAAGS